MFLNPCECKPIATKPLWAGGKQANGSLSLEKYKDKLTGCFLGKNIGGTAGAPMEWLRQINDFTFYTQELDGTPLPNDDLDIQLLWLIALEEKGLSLDAKTLGEYWLSFVTPHWSEYGIAKINMRCGLPPPWSGSHYNEFKDSCGAYIRSEIWAAIAPGAPLIAARYACEDASLDHGDGEGTYAEIFTAAMQAAAFVEDDFLELVEIGLSYIPEDCATAQAVHYVIEAHRAKEDYLVVRDEVLRRYRGCVSGANRETGSKEDYEKGFFDGKLGFDVPSNIAIVIIGMLYSEGDFDKLMQYTINCGEDTDCTAATAGAIYGLIHGKEGIPQRWLEPIGTSIRTGCLNLGELGGYGAEIPATIDELVERSARIGLQVSYAYEGATRLIQGSTEAKGNFCLYCPNPAIFTQMAKGPIYHFDFFDIQLCIEGGPTLKNGQEKKLELRIVNTYKHTDAVNIKVWAEEDLVFTPSRNGRMLVKSNYMRSPDFRGNLETANFTVYCEDIKEPAIQGVFQLTIPGRHTNMCIPFSLINTTLQNFSTDFYYSF